MKLAFNTDKHGTVRLGGVSCVRIHGESGALIAVAMEHGGAVAVYTADDAGFEAICRQYNIPGAHRARPIQTF